MCTAITFSADDFYFGRTLDLECSYGESVVITPRHFPLPFHHGPDLSHHHAIIGMAHVSDGYPLYYDAMNELGLCMAGLNFPEFAHYCPVMEGCNNVAVFEFIPWILGQCASASEARTRIQRLNLTDTPFSERYPVTSLHWLIADQKEAFTVETCPDGIRVYDNPVGVLTNSPPFDDQLIHLSNYLTLSAEPPRNGMIPSVELKPVSRGMGAIGLPGDWSSQSRFVRSAFVRSNSLPDKTDAVSQFFHMLGSVNQIRGCNRLDNGENVITQYTACCNASRGIYYFTTYQNRRIRAVDLRMEDSQGDRLIQYSIDGTEDILVLNK